MKIYNDADLGVVKIRKVARSKRLKIRLYADHVLVTQPTWTPYTYGYQFAMKNKAWILANVPAKKADYFDGQTIGKRHILHVVAADIASPRVRLKDHLVILSLPTSLNLNEASVQEAITKAELKVLRHEAEDYLPGRLRFLAQAYGFSYKSCSVKTMKSRWGSCSSKKTITLNLKLMKLNEDLIDYVMIHELCHLRQMNHSPDFWAEVAKYCPNYKALRKQLKANPA